ncbi:helix-turn-helix transcriptional regulator [Listeria booriae]|uniref:helix-turn-helix domain-containing protein n=1 Tax=Listeria booriae TaxID=1552123 RepID=UPI00162AF7D2|nr:helix-turn-helix transcriptional regulator [Listeria booriae]MBC2370070.1 helix-turn-helix transcriptional regulator [Listeria booriae]
MPIGKNISALRNKKGISQEKLAKDLNVSTSTVGMWETGKRAVKDDFVIQLANYFDVSTDYLLGKSNTDKRKTPDFANDLEWINDPELGYWWHSLTESEIKSLKKLWDVMEENKQNTEK